MSEPCADVRVTHSTFGPFRGGIYNIVHAYFEHKSKRRVVEVTISPTGRTVAVYVDGVQWKAKP